MKQKRGICDRCGHPRWQHFDQHMEACNQTASKCNGMIRDNPCYCQKYVHYKYVGSLEEILRNEEIVKN